MAWTTSGDIPRAMEGSSVELEEIERAYHRRDSLQGRLADAVERLGDAGRAMLREAAQQERLSVTQAQLLLRIATVPAGPQGTGSLARWLDVSAPTVSDAVAALVRKGLVEQAPHPTDRRRSYWRATAEGRQAAERLRRWRDPLLSAFDAVGQTDQAQALRVLLEAIAGLHRAGRISVARTCLTCRFFNADRPTERQGDWCGLLRAPLDVVDLRVDCPEHDEARA